MSDEWEPEPVTGPGHGLGADVPLSGKPARNPGKIPCGTEDPAVMPLPHLEARICGLAGHLEAGTCRYLMLVSDFDARQGWAEAGLPSCAAWLAWKCQVAPGTAREQVRVARALRDLPVIRGEFEAGRFSYAKVRALTRIATPESETELAKFAVSMTAGQLERFVRAHRQVERGETDGRPACREPRLTWRQDSTGTAISIRLPHEQAAVVLQALRAVTDDLDHPHHDHDGEGKTRAELLADADAERERGRGPGEKTLTPSGDLAQALVTVCGEYLSGRAAAGNPDTYQVIIHAGTAALAGLPENSTAGKDPGVPAETALPETHPAWPWRSHVQDGGHVTPEALAMIACSATVSAMLHDQDGTVLNVSRRTRRPPDALRRAVRERDRYRCRYPGCESRRTDAHHIIHWGRGGETSLANLISLCRRHHTAVHDTGIAITTGQNGDFTFTGADGTPIEAAPALPGGTPDGLAASHGTAVPWHAVIPPHSGERLDLHAAIWISLHNLQVQARRRERTGQLGKGGFATAT